MLTLYMHFRFQAVPESGSPLFLHFHPLYHSLSSNLMMHQYIVKRTDAMGGKDLSFNIIRLIYGKTVSGYPFTGLIDCINFNSLQPPS